VPTPLVRNRQLQTDTWRNNLFTNGGLEIWQRGTTFNATNGAFTADRWRSDIQGGSGEAINVVQITSTIGTPGLSAQLVYTHGTGTIQFMNWSEPGLLKALKGFTISVAFTVRSTVAGTVRPVFRSWSGGVTQYGNANVGTGIERLTVVTNLPANDPATGGILTGVELGNASCTVELNDATMVVGPVAADYVPLHPADDMARCQRYYEKHGPGGNYPQGTGYAAGASYYIGTSFPYHVVKPVVPTITLGGTFGLSNMNAPASYGASVDGVMIEGTTTAAGQVYWYSASSGYFTVEANP